ncbi:MAG: hypothetical protein IPP66_17845 [Anaerolineales bacterium]|nr:hypothetical protein [Anaerolineales bacterium]
MDRIAGPILTMLGGALVLAILFFDVKELSFVLFTVFILLLGVWGLVNWVRNSFLKIIFQEDKIIFVRRFINPITFLYSELTDIGFTQIKFGQRRISLMNMKNGDELLSAFQRLLDEKKIQPSQMDGKLIVNDVMTQRALLISAIPTILGGFALDFMLRSYFDINLDGFVPFSISFLVFYYGAYMILKNRYENKW